jgi:casein kinase II subunit alpha
MQTSRNICSNYSRYRHHQGIDYYNKKGIFHRDIKPQNVLIDSNTSTVRIIDWGLSDFYTPGTQYSLHVGTMSYKAPEILLKYQFYNYTLDIWSAGCIFLSMVAI